MTTNTQALPLKLADAAQRWHDFWRGQIGEWIITRGLRIAMLVIAAVLAARPVAVRSLDWSAPPRPDQ